MKLKNFVKTPEGKELASLCLDHHYKLAPLARDLTRYQINFLIAAMNERIERRTIEQMLGGEGYNVVLFD